MVIESLGRCYIQNINDVLDMIEFKDDQEEYFKIMKPLKYVDVKKIENDKEKGNQKKLDTSTVIVPASSLMRQKNKIQPIFQVTFDFDPEK